MNNSPGNEHISEDDPDVFARSALLGMNARAAAVNRTHRVVRERAKNAGSPAQPRPQSVGSAGGLLGAPRHHLYRSMERSG